MWNLLLTTCSGGASVNSPKVKNLISPEVCLEDRVCNIHLIMGNPYPGSVSHSLKRKFSSLNLDDVQSTIDSPITPSILENPTFFDHSLPNVENILTNHSEGVRLAIELIS